MTALQPRLLTIPFSHYCEKARWALDHHGVDFEEEGHVPVLHILAAKLAAGRRTLPVLIDGAARPNDSTDILRHLEDKRSAPASRLYPADAAQRAEADRLVTLFDQRLGPHVRRYAYWLILPETAIVRRMFRTGVGPVERLLGQLLFPVLVALMRQAMRIDDAGAARSIPVIEQVLAEVEALVEDGRPYLVGERFGAADLTFAALLGPLVLPKDCPATYPGLEELPEPAQGRLVPYRERPAGRFALRLYREARGGQGPS